MADSRIISITAPEGRAGVDATGALPPFDGRDIVRHGVDRHLVLVDGRGVERGRLSLWWKAAPQVDGFRTGVIGHYDAADAEAGSALLRRACRALAAKRCTLAVGPMDGTTWRRYRLVTERGHEPPFFLEPWNPQEYVSHFISCGFAVLARYTSSLVERLDLEDPRLGAAAARIAHAGVTLEELAPERALQALGDIYSISSICFAGSFLFTPLAEPAFLDMYRPLLPLVQPGLVLLARREGRAVGFVFAIPDGESLRTVVLKTVAVLPERALAGLGNVLVAEVHRRARELGYARVIHALMHESNSSRNLSARYGAPMRQYALFARSLGARR